MKKTIIILLLHIGYLYSNPYQYYSFDVPEQISKFNFPIELKGGYKQCAVINCENEVTNYGDIVYFCKYDKKGKAIHCIMQIQKDAKQYYYQFKYKNQLLEKLTMTGVGIHYDMRYKYTYNKDNTISSIWQYEYASDGSIKSNDLVDYYYGKSKQLTGFMFITKDEFWNSNNRFEYDEKGRIVMLSDLLHPHRNDTISYPQLDVCEIRTNIGKTVVNYNKSHQIIQTEGYRYESASSKNLKISSISKYKYDKFGNIQEVIVYEDGEFDYKYYYKYE